MAPATLSLPLLQGSDMPHERHPTKQLMLFLGLVSALEGADAMLLPASFEALQLDLGFAPLDLGSMSLAQAFMLSLAAPLWGIVADREMLPRRSILAVGAVGWGVITLLLASVSSRNTMILLRVANGSMLACLGPVTQGIIADVTMETQRGQVLGKLGLMTLGGNVFAALLTTPLSTQDVLGVQGWRVAFAVVGLVSLTVGALIHVMMEEPTKERWDGIDYLQDQSVRSKTPCSIERGSSISSIGSAVGEEAVRLRDYLRMPSFLVIVLQGCFGGMPWNALGFSTMYFQQAGFGDIHSSILSALAMGSGGVGNLIGGYVGDSFASRWPNHGRALAAQISVASGIPCVLLLYWLIPPNPAYFPYFASIVILLGLTSSWCSAGVNRPLLSEIVSPSGRSVIMAWDTALEGSMAALLGAPAVGVLSQEVFGFKLGATHQAMSLSAGTEPNTRALGMALVVSTTFPWIVCLLLYSLLHWSYPRDRAALLERRGASMLSPKSLP
eukprot:TRINITY_DN49243_c0_g1_i1.p1 TRINITY_DN49243_c0_g1~~TRINITY_DN49243_c0_g1_i1.p1  ORF type:complete len:510 (+),score=63.08 TRINITY_DN49243_c0_g1_i1:36-1532(+)